MNLNNKALKNINFIIISISCIVVLLIVHWSYSLQKNQAQVLLSEEEKLHVDSYKNIGRGVINRAISDLNLISKLPGFKGYLADDSDTNKKIVQDLFSQFSESRKVYDQIRFIDTSGDEIIRVNFSGGKAIVVAENLLQNKKGRYYFDDAIALKDGSVFISPLDLNIEQNKVEVPYKPMIRIATPVFNGKYKKGILVLNYLARELLDELNKKYAFSVNDYDKPELLDKDGYWLNSINKEREWAFMFDDKKDVKMPNSNPELWSAMQTKNEGQEFLEDGLYTFSKLSPSDDFGLSWIIYRFIPNSLINKNYDSSRWAVIAFDFFVAILFSILFLANNFIYKKNEEQKKGDDLLKQKAEEAIRLNDIIYKKNEEQKKGDDLLKQKAEEAMRLNEFMVNRELKMIELKKEIEELKSKLQSK